MDGPVGSVEEPSVVSVGSSDVVSEYGVVADTELGRVVVELRTVDGFFDE